MIRKPSYLLLLCQTNFSSPEVLAQPDPVDNKVYPHNAWVVRSCFLSYPVNKSLTDPQTDGVLPYIEWATSAGYGVIDINIPSYITDPENRDSYIAPLPQVSPSGTPSIENEAKDLVCYLWDNYLTGYACNTIVVMGVGDAYLGAKQLLVSRGTWFPTHEPLPPKLSRNLTSSTDSRHHIACILSFVTGTLRPVKSETDPQLSQWYKSQSLIFVSPDHSCFSDAESAKKVRKNRFGGVRQSSVSGLNAMLRHHREEGCEWIEEKVKQRWRDMGLGENGEDLGDETESEGRE
jgi:histone deacetylase 6